MKIKLILIALALSAGAVQAQKDQFTLLKELGEGSVIDMYKVWKNSDGTKEGKRYKQFSLSYLENEYGKMYGFKGTDVNADKTPQQTARIIAGENYVGNHYTKPSLIYMESTLSPENPGKTFAFILIDDVLYKIGGDFKEMKAGGKYYIHEEMYMISKRTTESSTDSESKTKGKLGSKLKNKLESYNGYEKPAPKELTEVDHKAVIDKYLKEMEKIQSEYTYTDAEKKEMAQILAKKKERAAKGKAANEEYEKKMAEERAKKKGTPDKLDDGSVYIKNESGKEIHIAHFGGSSTVSNGSTYRCSCKHTNVTYATLQGNSWKSNGVIISAKDTNCGKEVVVR